MGKNGPVFEFLIGVESVEKGGIIGHFTIFSMINIDPDRFF